MLYAGRSGWVKPSVSAVAGGAGHVRGAGERVRESTAGGQQPTDQDHEGASRGAHAHGGDAAGRA